MAPCAWHMLCRQLHYCSPFTLQCQLVWRHHLLSVVTSCGGHSPGFCNSYRCEMHFQGVFKQATLHTGSVP